MNRFAAGETTVSATAAYTIAQVGTGLSGLIDVRCGRELSEESLFTPFLATDIGSYRPGGLAQRVTPPREIRQSSLPPMETSSLPMRITDFVLFFPLRKMFAKIKITSRVPFITTKFNASYPK